MKHEHNSFLPAKAMMRRATQAAVCVAGGLICLKVIAWTMTGSVSLLSSLIDSSMDIIASGLNLIAIRHALVPADDDHRFGHGKLEALAGLGQAAFIAGSAVFLILEAGSRFVKPVMIERGWIGIVVMVISIFATFVLVHYQRRVIKETNSIAITADSLHYSGDILINAGIIVSLVLSMAVGWTFLDPFFAIIIALFLLWNVWKILMSSFDYLMDRELVEERREQILALSLKQDRVLGVHELRTRSSGACEFIQLHLELDDHLSLGEAHSVSVHVETAIRQDFPNAEIIIHQDPVSVVQKELGKGENR